MILARHDPTSRYDRFPQGACPAGSVVCLHLDSEGDVRAAYVRLWRGGGEEWHPMRQSARGGWEAEISAGNDPGLVWYYFVLDTGLGRRYVGKPETDVCAREDVARIGWGGIFRRLLGGAVLKKAD